MERWCVKRDMSFNVGRESALIKGKLEGKLLGPKSTFCLLTHYVVNHVSLKVRETRQLQNV